MLLSRESCKPRIRTGLTLQLVQFRMSSRFSFSLLELINCDELLQDHGTRLQFCGISSLVSSRVGGIFIFCDFQKWAHCCRLAFFSSILKKIGNFSLAPARRTRGKVLIFFFTETLKINIFLRSCKYLPFN